MSTEQILENMPFDSLEDLTEWSLNYLKNKEVKVQDLVDFFTIINGNQTVIYDISSKDDDSGEIIKMKFTLFFAEYKVKLCKSAGKVSTFIVRDIEII